MTSCRSAVTLSWNEKTREVVTHRLADRLRTEILYRARVSNGSRHRRSDRAATGIATADSGAPRWSTRNCIRDKEDGYRHAGMPREGRGMAAWTESARRGGDARLRRAASTSCPSTTKTRCLARMQKGELKDAAWGDMPSDTFFKMRMARDIVLAYYSHPTAWSEIGWGGPASPRGYVRMDFNERDPWEAAEVKNGDVEAARRKNRRV